MDQESFCWGFVLGSVLFAGIGYIGQQILLAQRRADTADKPQPIPTQAGVTPRQTVRMSRRAKIAIAGWIIALALLVACIGFLIVQAL